MLNNILSFFKELSSGLEKEEKIELLNKKLLVECTYNLSLINCLKLEDIPQKSREALKIATLMETSFLEIHQLEKIKNTTLLNKLADSNTDDLELENDDLIHNILLKIKLLKAINELPFEEKEDYKNFRIKVRMEFLQKKLTQLSELLLAELEHPQEAAY